MELFKDLQEKVDAAINGTSNSIEFYKTIFAKMVLLKPEQRHALIEKAEKLTDDGIFDSAALGLLKGMNLVFESKFQMSIGFLIEANELFTAIDEKGGVMSCNNLLCISYRSLGQLDIAQVHIQKSLRAAEYLEKKSPFYYYKTITYYQAGELHSISKNYELAKEYYQKGMEFVGENSELEGRLLNGLGNVLLNTHEWEKALDYLNRSLATAKKANNPLLESKSYADIGNYYQQKKDYPLALENQYKSLEIRTEKGFLNPSITNYTNLAGIYLELNDIEQAIKFATFAVETSSRLNVLIKLYEAHDILAKAYEKSGDTSKAYEHFKLFHKYKEEVYNQETIKKIEQLQSSHKIELMQQEKEIFRLRNVELKEAMEEIQDSFRYASRIQTSLLPTEVYIEKTLKRLKD